LEDGRIDENMLALSIGLTTTGVYGLARAVNSEQWYRNIILHDSLYSCEQLLEFVYPELAKQNSWKLPVWYYISKSNMKSELAEEKAPHSYTEIVTESTIKRNRSAIGERTAWEVWTQRTKLSQTDVDNFNAQYPKLDVKYTRAFHDRFLILDKTKAYHVGASLKDAGKKCFGINLIEDAGIVRDILQRLELETEE